MKQRTEIDIKSLPIKERIQLVGDIWDSIAQDAGQLPLTHSQRDELDQRLERYKVDPLPGSSWTEVRKRIER
ncbi:MAG: addiction module protein [Candidatus Marinimicrobia bacterium]|nr:addiction module protein [Candidatus Neomarinimicrobiota bacterium]